MFRFPIKFIVMAATLLSLLAFAPARTEAAVAPPVIVGGGGSNPGAGWALGGCSAGIILAGLMANARDNRELTAPEAWTCGLLFWFERPVEKPKKHFKSGR
jgi:hypothetical protein